MSSIRSRIMLPMALFMVLLPLCTYWAFSLVAGSYMEELARAKLAESLNDTTAIVQEVYDSYAGDLADETLSFSGKQALAKEVLSKTRKALRNNQFASNLIVINENSRILYPSDADEEENAIVDRFDIQRDAQPPNAESLKLRQLDIDGKRYFACMIHLPAPVRGKSAHSNSLIVYNSINDVSTLMNTSARLVLIITAILSLAALVVAYLAARSISRPIASLSAHLAQVGGGRFEPMRQVSSIRDVQELITATNNMAAHLDKYDRAQKTFFQNASHELRTPLMSIQGYAEGIQCGVWDDPTEAAGIIASESQRLTTLVDELLTLSRLDNGQQSVDIEEIDLAAYLSNTLERMRGMTLHDGISLNVAPGPQKCMILGDEVLLMKALNNLLSNAIRYARTQVTARIETEEDRVRLFIYNDGPAIPLQDLERIFDRFFKGEGGHCGIGLSVARSAAEYMGGGIRALPREEGAEFEMTLAPAKR